MVRARKDDNVVSVTLILKRGGVCFLVYSWTQLPSVLLPSVLWRCWLGVRKSIRPVKTEWWGAGVVICLERDADLHNAQLMPLPLTVSCFSKIQIGFTFLVLAHPGSPGQRAIKRVYVYSWTHLPAETASTLTKGRSQWTVLLHRWQLAATNRLALICKMNNQSRSIQVHWWRILVSVNSKNKAVIDRRLHHGCCHLGS